MKLFFAFLLIAFGFLLMPGISFGQSALIVDPAIQQVVDDVLPAKYVSYANAVLLASLIIGRWLKSIAAGRGIKGWFSSIWCGTNESTKLLIGCLCLLSLPACSTPEQNARLGQLVTLAVDLAEKRGAITPADAEAIRAAETIILPSPAALPAIDVTSGK